MKRNLSRLQQKSGSERISDLDEALQIARELLSLPTLPEKEQQDIQKWELEARKKRAIIKSESGEIESMAGLGRLREAIERMEDFIKRGRYEFEDREGNIVPTAEKLREYNEEYAVFCTQKAREYLERANKSLPVYPMAAVEVLQFALREFSRADPLILEELELELQKAKELVIVADNVQGLISLALRFIKQPISRLEFLLAAKKQLDPKIVELDTLIEREQLDATAFLEESDRTIQSYLANEDINLALKIANEILELGQNIKGENKQLDESLCKIEQIVSRYKDYPHNFRPN